MIRRHFYNKPVDGLCTFEWQHSEGNFERVIKIGISGIKKLIEESKKINTEKDETIFLDGLDKISDAIVAWANKCSDYAVSKAAETSEPEYKNNLTKLSKALKKIPNRPAESFYEAVLCIYICYPFLPDSIGLIDRQLISFYRKDIESGELTRDEAKSYLQELFLMLQSRININNDRFNRGGESHFCIGGYLPDGSDGFNELSYLILESLMELPTAIPQISLRHTKKTPREVLRYVMDCERHDSLKRIAFVADEPRIKAWTEISGFPLDTAVNYTMVGCNEPAMTGGKIEGGSKVNIARSMANTFKKREKEIKSAKTFDDFYKIYEEELFSDIDEAVDIDNGFGTLMARDINLVSAIFIDGCIEKAKSPTCGGASRATPIMNFIGLITVFDSLAVIKQFVFDEKLLTMEELASAVNANWSGYEDMHTLITKKAKYFGNDDTETNATARRFTDSIYRALEDKRTLFGKKYLIGNLVGYNEHHKFFGELTTATPDGRYDGDMISYGLGQGNDRDRQGLSALLSSVACCDENAVLTGPSVTNVLLDETLIKNDEHFEKLVALFEAYLNNGGTHFQLNYVSREDLLNAKVSPDKYKNLRVRVSGFSDYFVNLNDGLQDEIILRTVKDR